MHSAKSGFAIRAAAVGAVLMLALGMGLAGPPAAWAQAGTDIQVNDSTTDTPEATTQSETTLAVRGSTLCAGFNDGGAGAGLSGYARSVDLGLNWTDLGTLGAGNRGDPVIVVHQASGTFYYAEIATIAGGNAIGVARSTDDCVNFGAPVDASPNTSPLAATTLSDKPWIAVDNTGGARDGDVYVCWTRFIDNNADGQADTSELRFSRSTDGGATYTNEQVLAPQGTNPFGCSVGVGPNGEVYVSWADRAGATANDIRFRASVDGGATFGANTQVSTGNRHPGVDRIVMCDVNRRTLNGNIRMLHQSWLAVDATGGPFDGNIYAVWASDPVDVMGGSDHSDVFFSRSTDGGATWSAPLQLGGGTLTDQFEPFVAVAGAGAVSVAWYDRRNDLANNLNVDVYKAFSSDGGATFGAIQRVTDLSFGVPQLLPNFDPGIALCYMGEYIAVTGDARSFYYLWGDNRNTVTSVNFPAGRPDPDVFFEFEPAPVVNDADLSIEKSDSPDPVVAGEELVYTIEVENDGPHIALDVQVTDTLPAEVTYLSDTGGCDATALPVLTCALGTIASGGSQTFTITVRVNADTVYVAGGPTTITNTATVDAVANDPDPGNDTASEDTDVVAEADLAIVSFAALAPPAQLLIGDEVDVTLRKVITNLGPSAPMDVALEKTATASAGATVVPAAASDTETAVGLSEERVHDELFTISCQEPGPHTFTFENEIAPADPADTDPNPANNSAEEVFVVECVVPVAINIKPGSFPNSINIRSNGVIPVAVLTTDAGEYGLPLAFDATTIDPLSVRFGPEAVAWAGGGAPEAHGRGHLEDSIELDETTSDGDLDLVLHFRTQETGLAAGDTVACVKGTFTGSGGMEFVFFGCDSVSIIG
jgi:uncharacterized repeat protein (TIGR01451 family)